MRLTSIARWSGAGGLMLVAALHAIWASGSAWPARSRAELSDAIIGGPNLPGTTLTLIVSALLALAAMLVSPIGLGASRTGRVGAAGVVLVLSLRAAAGFVGMLPQERRSDTFRRWNRRVYSPLCLALAALSSSAMFSEST